MTGDHAPHRHQHHGDGPADAMGEDFWDARYRSSPALWSGHANPQLVTEVAHNVAGAALDVGCGEGADAIWLAERGWRVTAVDLSSVALERGAAQASEVGTEVAQRITWLHADLTEWVPAASTYDLVSAQFLHLPRDQREPIHRRIAESVAPGGILLIVGHHVSDLQTTIGRPQAAELFFAPGEVGGSLVRDDWVILVDEDRPRQTVDADGHPVTVRDSVFKAQRAG